MENLIKRHFWLVHLLGLGLIAALLGGVINGVVAMKLASLAGSAPADFEGGAADGSAGLSKRLAALRAGEGSGGNMASRSPFLIDEPPPPPEEEVAAEEPPPEEEQAAGPLDASYEVTKLPLRLLGTMVVRPVEYSSATMEVNRQDHKLVTIGYELLEGQAKVRAIERTYVVLEETGKLTIAPLWPRGDGGGAAGQAQAAPPASPLGGRMPMGSGAEGPRAAAAGQGPAAEGVQKLSDTTYQLDRGNINKKLENLAALGQQVRVVPNYRGGKYDGFRMIGMASSSLFRDIGFENGDIIKVINGNKIDSPNKALALYEALKNKSRLTVQLERGGMLKTMRYTVK